MIQAEIYSIVNHTLTPWIENLTWNAFILIVKM